MNARNLICVCGAAAAMLTAPALAQQGTTPTNPRPDSTTQPGQTRTTPPTPSTQTGLNQQDAVPEVLERLAGVWKVEVSINNDAFAMNKDGKHDHSAPKTDRPADATRPSDAMRPDSSQPDVNKHAMGSSKNFTGYAERKLVLGDNILQETIVVPDMLRMGLDQDRTNPRDPANLEQPDGNAFRGMSFISFNDDNDTYRIVFIDSKHKDIHVDSGTYDASRSRLVFHGKAGEQTGTPSSNKTGTTPGNQSDPADFSRVPARTNDMKTTGGSNGYGDVRVVLEIIGDDQHQVTMYKVASDATRPGEPRTGTPTDRPSTQPGTPGTGQPGTTGTGAGTGQPGTDTNRNNAQTDMRTLANAGENIIYRAIYTRATGAEAARFQRLIDDDRALTRADRTDR